jgi:hypothetical protein
MTQHSFNTYNLFMTCIFAKYRETAGATALLPHELQHTYLKQQYFF